MIKINKETWEKILKEYLESKESSNFICYRSKTFEKLYSSLDHRNLLLRKDIELRDEIMLLVSNFTSSYKPSNGAIFGTGTVSRHFNLFIFINQSITKSHVEYETEKRAVRINFLNYCIANTKYSFWYNIYHTIKSFIYGKGM